MATSAAESNTNLQQTASGPGSLAARKSVFAQNRIPGMNRESNIDQIIRTGSSQTPRAPMQSPLQRQSTLRTNQLQAQNPLRQPVQATHAQEIEDGEEEEEEQQRQVSFQSFMQLIRIKGAITDAAEISQKDDDVAKQTTVNISQDATRQAAKKMVPKAANAGANFLSTVLDLGTGGGALLVTIFIHLLSLGWLNVEMVYGTWIKKGKDPIVGKLSWDPIPMPVDKNGIMLQGLVIMADLIVLTVIVILFAIQILVLLLFISPTLLVGFGISKLF
jgi:hypothetical protein